MITYIQKLGPAKKISKTDLAIPIQITTVDVSDDNKWLADYGAFPSIENNLKFEVKGCKDAHMILSSQLIKITPFYHIGIGLYTNTKTILARERIAYEYVDEHLENNLDCNNFLQFWLSWKNGKIRFGKGLVVHVNTILAYDEACPFAIQNIEISADEGVTLAWNFYPSVSTPVEQPAPVIAKSYNEIHTCPRFQSINTKQVKGLMMCACVCVLEQTCHAFMFNNNTGNCDMYSNIAN
ncbi:unnamed protein product [Mytilus coruscus]|uniref:Apple domain-containing protein n=1 Tax=Mytilus coruscus TaxID=42192 RepID=A0A6J8D4Z3_MYTCO|nr:unnamed protein product [Mytilus coruscus]